MLSRGLLFSFLLHSAFVVFLFLVPARLPPAVPDEIVFELAILPSEPEAVEEQGTAASIEPLEFQAPGEPSAPDAQIADQEEALEQLVTEAPPEPELPSDYDLPLPDLAPLEPEPVAPLAEAPPTVAPPDEPPLEIQLEEPSQPLAEVPVDRVPEEPQDLVELAPEPSEPPIDPLEPEQALELDNTEAGELAALPLDPVASPVSPADELLEEALPEPLEVAEAPAPESVVSEEPPPPEPEIATPAEVDPVTPLTEATTLAQPLEKPQRDVELAAVPQPQTPRQEPREDPTPQTAQAEPAPAPQETANAEPPPQERAPARQPAPRGAEGPQDLVRTIQAQVQPCWRSAPSSGGGVSSVVLRVSLNRNGSIANARVKGSGDQAFRQMAKGAQAAFLRCGPYRLPGESYAVWRELEVEFHAN
ncbi:MAG: hypothetical protein Kilf2KO_18320 [Rhodospirillales bacterium]